MQIVKRIIALSMAGAMAVNCAWSMPVEDPTEWAKTTMVYQQAVSQLAQLKQTYQQVTNLKGLAQQQLSNITGKYGMGNIVNTVNDLKNREWAGANWQDTLKGIAGGNNQRYKQLLTSYINSHKVTSSDDYAKSHSQADAQN